MPDWRRPISATVEEKASGPVVGGGTPITQTIYDEAAFDEMRDGRRCANCRTGYPAPVAPENVPLIMREKANWPYGDAKARALLVEQRCGVCGAGMRAEDRAKLLDEAPPRWVL
jgi:hypothetical protein